MNILKFIDQLSFKKIVLLSFVAALVLAIPLSVWVVQQQTRLDSEAFFSQPKPIAPDKKYGPVSAGQPQITLVWPFLGKIGDAVLIYGFNFGNNPLEKTLTIGSRVVPEDDIKKWTPELIEFVIPPNSQSEPISLKVAGKTALWDYPFTVYDLDTKIQVTEKDNIVRVINPPAGAGAKIKLYFRNGDFLESSDFKQTSYPEDKEIISVEIVDANNNSLPFFVEPDEFGF